MPPKFYKADSAVRRNAMLTIFVAALLGPLVIYLFLNHSDSFFNWFISDASQLAPRLKLLLTIVAIFGALLPIALAVNLWLLGNRVIVARRFPLEGQSVIRDTLILEGRAA